MKQTLRKRIEALRDTLLERIKQLEQHMEEYKRVDNFEGAMKCDIKRRELSMMAHELTKELNNY